MSVENCRYLKIACEELKSNPGITSAQCGYESCSIEVKWKTWQKRSVREAFPHAKDVRFSHCGRLLARISQLGKMLGKKSHPLRGEIRWMRENEYNEKTEEARELEIL